MLFVSILRIVCESRYVAQPLYLNAFVAIEKMKRRNYN